MIKKYNLSGLWDFELDADKAGLKKWTCGAKLISEVYKMSNENKHGHLQSCVFCDECNQFCTDSTSPSKVLEELKCIEQVN